MNTGKATRSIIDVHRVIHRCMCRHYGVRNGAEFTMEAWENFEAMGFIFILSENPCDV